MWPPRYIILIFQSYESAFRYSLVSAQSLQLLHGHPEVERVKVPFLKLAVSLATSLGHDPRPYNKQLSELRYTGVKTDSVPPLMEVVRWVCLQPLSWSYCGNNYNSFQGEIYPHSYKNSEALVR